MTIDDHHRMAIDSALDKTIGMPAKNGYIFASEICQIDIFPSVHREKEKPLIHNSQRQQCNPIDPAHAALALGSLSTLRIPQKAKNIVCAVARITSWATVTSERTRLLVLP